MIIVLRILISVVLVVCCGRLFPQAGLLSESADTIIIKASKFDIDQSKKQITQRNSLVDALKHISPIQVQSNGPGYLSTALIHGFGARHTAIIWNEFNIQSPVNGTFDLSLINGFDKLSYTERSAGAYLGTASLAGAIILDDESETVGTEISLHYAAIQNTSASIKHSFKTGNFISNVQLGLIKNQNKFKYKWNGEEQVWAAPFDGKDFKWSGQYVLNELIKLDGNIWLQQYDRSIPTSLVSASNFADQIDNNYRYNLSANYVNGQTSGKISYVHFKEIINYFSSAVDSRATNNVNAINLSLKHSNHRFNLSHRNDRTDANFFSDIHGRNLSLLTYGYKHNWNKRLSNNLVISRQLNVANWSPILYDFKTSFKTKNVSVLLSINKSYNVPTLNDLYWPQGGNPDLLPEESNGIDLDVNFELNENFTISLSPYFQSVTNWILWTPGDQFWSPKNQRSVHSKGIDLAATIKGLKQLTADINFSYTDATIQEELSFSDLLGKQLIYVPKIKSSIVVNYALAGFIVRPSFQYISKRYITTDNKSYLPQYGLIDLELSRSIKLNSNHQVQLGLIINNLLNNNYQQIQFYPMPLRYLGLSINYKSKKRK